MGYWAAFIGLLMIGVGQALGGVPAWPGENDPEALAYRDSVVQIRACKDKQDLKRLETLAEELHARWSGRTALTQASILLEIAGAFATTGSDGERRLDLASKYALLGLQRADELPLHVEADLLKYIDGGAYTGQHALVGGELAKRRTSDAKLMLHCWKRVEGTIDRNWDLAKDAPGPLRPPPGVSRGQSPERIADPVLREQYKAAIEQHRQRASRYAEQVGAIRFEVSFSKGAREWFVRAYSMPPANIEEMLTLLNEYKIDQATQIMIQQQIAARMPRPAATRPVRVPADLTPVDRLRRERIEMLRNQERGNAP